MKRVSALQDGLACSEGRLGSWKWWKGREASKLIAENAFGTIIGQPFEGSRILTLPDSPLFWAFPSQWGRAIAGGAGPAYPWWCWSQEKLWPEGPKRRGDSFFLPGSFPWVMHFNLVLIVGRATSKGLSMIFFLSTFDANKIPFPRIIAERVYLAFSFRCHFFPSFWTEEGKGGSGRHKERLRWLSHHLSLEATTLLGVIKTSYWLLLCSVGKRV